MVVANLETSHHSHITDGQESDRPPSVSRHVPGRHVDAARASSRTETGISSVSEIGSTASLTPRPGPWHRCDEPARRRERSD